MSHSQGHLDATQVVVPAAGEKFVAEDGTVSVVLADTVDADYEPTQEEVEEFAEWMGMQLPADKEFLHIAREGLKAPLPADWRPCRTNEDEIYYFNFRTGESTWNHPMDEFFRQKFLKAKEQKRTAASAPPGAPKPAAAAKATSGGVPGLGGGGGAGPVGILKKHPTETVGGAPVPLAHAFVPALGASRSLAGGSATTPRETSAPADAFKQATAAVATSQGPPERRIVSEAEKNLEEKLRLEREAEFKEEAEKAEAAHEARLEEMRRAHAAEVERLQAECEARRAAMEGLAAPAPSGAEREAMERRWRAGLEQALQEERELRQQLVELGEQHRERLSGEVAKLEAAAAAQRAREEKQLEAESLAALKKLEVDTRAEAAKKKAELRQTSQAELQRLKVAAEKQHQAELVAIRERQTARREKGREGERKSAGIRAKEEEALAALERKSKEEQDTFRATMEETLSCLRKEICALAGSVPVTLGNASSSPADDALDKVRRRWQEEERNRMRALEEERQNRLSSVDRLRSTPASSASPVAAGSALAAGKAATTAVPAGGVSGDPRAANEAILAAKEKSLQETEAFLRTTLEGELARTDAPAEVQVAEAVKNDMKVFVRAKELSRRLEREDFERRRDAALAEHRRAKAAYEQRVAEQRARLEAESKAEMEEMMREVEEREVEKALQALTAQREVAEGKLKQRYADERRVLLAETEEELLAYAQKRRVEIAAQGESQAKRKETEMRSAAEAKAKALAAVEQARQQSSSPPPAPTLGVPMEVLQQRLGRVEKAYAEQERKLQAELDSIHAEVRRLGEELSVQGQQGTPLPQAGVKLTPEVFSTTAAPLGKKGQQHSSLFVSEALRFLGEQQRELSVRLGALRAAREEWQRDVRNASSLAPASPQPGNQLSGLTTEGAEALNSKLLTLVGTLTERLEALTGRISHMRTPAAATSPQQREGQLRPRLDRQHRREKEVAGRSPAKRNRRERDAARETHVHGTPVKQHGTVNLLQRWDRILREFATPPSGHAELSGSIKRLVADQ
ncbi:putative glutamic acid-rich protein precursor [Trypanosoma conorhini]|uniref:Putative glutamic acid-rich protein n=1 Tax=Trypanosoma conorhini TaxID=83891 RepID=A0A3R7KY68_9TRYP|nr:putative glutamic acid-rich protein precursor [Trypanosoma conorhini]RNF17436.1 putative glutamic acid-rich protein precursor [Trypanosoma conorhini]